MRRANSSGEQSHRARARQPPTATTPARCPASGVHFAHLWHTRSRSSQFVRAQTVAPTRCFGSGRFVIVRVGGFRDAEVAGSNPAFPTLSSRLCPAQLDDVGVCLVPLPRPWHIHGTALLLRWGPVPALIATQAGRSSRQMTATCKAGSWLPSADCKTARERLRSSTDGAGRRGLPGALLAAVAAAPGSASKGCDRSAR